MMDETAYKSVRGEINRLPCVFEKALLARHAVCGLAANRAIGEREVIACTSPLARAECGQLSGLLREKSAFALKTAPNTANTPRILTHAAVMKIQCGGLQGLQGLLDPEAPAPDVRRLVLLGRERFGDLGALPFPEIIKGVAAFRLRGKRP